MVGLRRALALLAAQLLLVTGLVVAPAESQAVPSVLMVVGDPAGLSVGDVVVRDRLVGLGFVVDVVDDAVVSVGDAVGVSFVFVSSSIHSYTLGSTLKAAGVPVWVAKPWLLDDMGMAGLVGGVDFGSVSSSSVTVVDVGHPLAGGLSGVVEVTGSSQAMSFGVPGGDGVVVTSAAGVASTFVYEGGGLLADGSVAAGCRVHSSVFRSAPEVFTVEGWVLFDAAVNYAANDCQTGPVDLPPTVSVVAPVDGSVVGGVVDVVAVAGDDVAVVGVEFFVGGVSVGVDVDGGDGWSYLWDTTAGADGPVAVMAVASDSIGQTASSSVSVTVANSGVVPSVLMVVGDPAGLSVGDVVVRDRLVGLGFVVDVVDDAVVSVGDAVGVSFVFVSSSIHSYTLGSTLKAAGVPVWVAKPWLLDDMGMAGLVGGVDFGSVSSSSVTVVDVGHPLAGGLSGVVEVTGSSQAMSFGVPGGDGVVVTSAAGVASTFVYEGGGLLADGSVAAGCRVHSSVFRSAPEVFTVEGWVLFDAAVNYAANDCS